VSLRRATGQAAFAGDVAPPGLLHVALRRSAVAHARVRVVDPSPAVALPGVAAVLTPADAPALLRGQPTFVGDRLAAVAAEDPELARRAADLLGVELEPLPAVLDAEAAAGDDTCVAARLAAEDGDVEGALARAGHVVSGEWRLPVSPAVSLEPPLAVTWLDEDRRLVVRTSAGSPFRVRGLLAERLALPAAGIRVARPRVAGGGAGRPDLLVEDLCAAVTLRTGRPARGVLAPDEALSLAPARPAQRARVRLALHDGRLSALDVDLLVDVGAEADPAAAAELLRSAARHALALYRTGAMRVRAVAVRTNRPPAALARGSDSGAALAVECAMDEAAELAGVDPAVFRRRLVRAPGDPGHELLAALGEMTGADGARGLLPLLASLRSLPVRARRGLASVETADPVVRHSTGLGAARRSASASAAAGAAASLRLLDDGSFALTTGTPAGGGADETLFAEAAAAILTVPPAQVVSAGGDTDSAAFDGGDLSPAVFVTRRAVEETARAALVRIRAAGARVLDVDPGLVTVEGGSVRAADERSASFAEIGRAALRAGEPLVITTAPASGAWPPSLAAAEADVDVDADTGVVSVTRLAAVVEGGPFADASAVLAEVEGALAAAVEQALATSLPFDAEGRPRLRDIRTYPLLAATDMPPIAVTFLPSGEADAGAGGASLADAAGRAALAAIVNAVARATGGRPRALPLDPPRVLEALSRRAAP
jgi:putative selenate reductase molybdopterin-binding subunit